MSAERDHPQMGSWGKPTLGIRGAKTFIKRPRRVECTTFKVQLRQAPDHSWEADLHTPDCCFTWCWSPWHWPLEVLPCWTEDVVCPAAHLAPESLPYKTLMTPLPTVLPPWPADRDSGTRVCYPHCLLHVCVIFLLDHQSVRKILMYVDVLLRVNLHSIKAEWTAESLCVTLSVLCFRAAQQAASWAVALLTYRRDCIRNISSWHMLRKPKPRRLKSQMKSNFTSKSQDHGLRMDVF